MIPGRYTDKRPIGHAFHFERYRAHHVWIAYKNSSRAVQSSKRPPHTLTTSNRLLFAFYCSRFVTDPWKFCVYEWIFFYCLMHFCMANINNKYWSTIFFIASNDSEKWQIVCGNFCVMNFNCILMISIRRLAIFSRHQC